jgi:hypothetical protein
MCVPGPGLLAEEGPRAWPGRVRVGVDMIVVSVRFGGGVARMRGDLQGTFWEKLKVTFARAEGLGFKNRHGFRSMG